MNVNAGDCWEAGIVDPLSPDQIDRYREENIKWNTARTARFRPGLIYFRHEDIIELEEVVYSEVQGVYLGERHCEARLLYQACKARFPNASEDEINSEVRRLRRELARRVQVLFAHEDIELAEDS